MSAKPALAVAALAGSVLACGPVWAQERGAYLGGSLGQATFTDWCVSSPSVLACDDTDSAWKIFGGYRVNQYFAIEGTYINWGQVTGRVAGTGDVSAEQRSIGAAAVGSFRFTPQFSVFGKFGLLLTEQETPASTTTQREDTELHYGVGVRFAFTPQWAARAEWERTDELKVEMLSIGAEYRF